jgi:cytochrome c oxidase subunit 3/cytochrome o ubiquinol oxidase subunit 3
VIEENGETELIGVHNKGDEVQREVALLQQEHPGATVTPSAPKPITWTTSLYGSTFFTLTGFHGTHVGIGVLWLGIVLTMSLLGKISSKNSLTVEMAGLYWHFVDLVWVAIFTLVYLI